MFSCATKHIFKTGVLRRTLHLRHLSPVVIKISDLTGTNNLNYMKNNFYHSFPNVISLRRYSDNKQELTESQFLVVCEDTLQSLYEQFEEISDKYLIHIKDADIMYEGGILKVDLGSYGTYVINRQTPNKQIWLSSPISGPKRYDYIKEGNDKGYWIYKHDGVTLHRLLQTEINKILSKDIDFSQCVNSKL